MSSGPIEIVCLMAGETLADDYVDRLSRMLRRNTDRDFRLSCLTDSKRCFSEPIEQIPIERNESYRADMRPTQHKLELFRGGGWPFEEFVYLDLTLVVLSDLGPLWSLFEARTEPLVGVQDWEWQTLNTCVMRIRRCAELGSVYEDYVSGVAYATRLKGDQDYLTVSLQTHGLMDRVATAPSNMVASYKRVRRLHRLQPRRAKRALEEAVLLKFHGKPRPHELFSEDYWKWHSKRSPISAIRDRGYLSDLVGELWK